MKMEENRLGEFVDKAKQGDSAAFEKLYSISCKKVYFTCISFLRNEENAKDVMQNVYITAYEKLTSLNDAEKFVPWINKIAVNKCKKLLMKRTAVFVDVEETGNELTEENENFLPEEYITQKEKRKLVMDIMRNTLSDIQYKTVILYYFNGLSVDEIADIMECPPGTVTYRLSVARAKIRDGVDAYENKSGDKLYSIVGLPLLMRLLYEEAESMAVPDILHDIMVAVRGHLAAGTMENAATAGETAGTIGSGAAAGEAAGTMESATAAGEAAQNTIGGMASGVKGGIMKAGMNTLIAKIGIAAAAVAVISVGAVFFIRNSGEEEGSGGGTQYDAQDQTSGHESEGDAQGQSPASSVDLDAVEEYGYPPFWLKYANLGALEEKDLSSVLFYDKVPVGTSLAEVISSYNYIIASDSHYNWNHYDSLEAFMEWATTESMGVRDTRIINCFIEEDNRDTNMAFEIRNLTDSEVTVWECIENNQFEYQSPYTIGWEILGVPIPYVQYTDNKEGLTGLVELLGRPTLVAASFNYISETDREGEEEFAETVFRGGGNIGYHLIYERGDYILDIIVCENCHDGAYEIQCQASYYTRGYFEYWQPGKTFEDLGLGCYDFE